MATPPLLDAWLQRLGSSNELDLSAHGHEVVPELLAAYTPAGFKLNVLPGSTLWVVEGDVTAELSAELEPTSLTTDSGVIWRRLDTHSGTAEHLKLELPVETQGQGRGRRLLRSSVDLYEDLGIHEVTLTAVDTGRYAWAAAGFSFQTEEGRHDVAAGVAFAAELLGLEIGDLDADQVEPWQLAFMPPVEGITLRDALEALDPEGLEALGGSADNLDEPLARPGKVLLLADEVPGWQGVLDLRPSDANPGLEFFYAYTD